MNKSILFVGHSFYNCWYLSRELRKIGWKSELINIDTNPATQGYYHGEDFRFSYSEEDLIFRLNSYLNSFANYEIFHFANKGGIYFLNEESSIGRKRMLFPLMEFIYNVFFEGKSYRRIFDILLRWRLLRSRQNSQFRITALGLTIYRFILKQWFIHKFGKAWDIKFLKMAGKKIGYSNNGCNDGVLKSSFANWSPFNTCSICNWNNHSEVCSDHLNAQWGQFRNEIADYQCNIGCNKADFNLDESVFESPWFYCLDSGFWNPDGLIPSNYMLPYSKEIVKVYHSVGNFESRSNSKNVTIKCTHIYLELFEKFKFEGLPTELIFFHGVPNKIVKYYQMQADIVVDMLTFGFFGANVREAMMLGKPVICYLRPEWLEEMRNEIPEYVNELPIISATPETIEEILKDLITDKDKRIEIGKRSREFAVKWHGSINAAKYFDQFLQLQMENKATKKGVIDIQKQIYN